MTELRVEPGSWFADRRLRDLQLRQEGVVVLGIEQTDGTYLGVPVPDTVIELALRVLPVAMAISFVGSVRGRPGDLCLGYGHVLLGLAVAMGGSGRRALFRRSRRRGTQNHGWRIQRDGGSDHAARSVAGFGHGIGCGARARREALTMVLGRLGEGEASSRDDTTIRSDRHGGTP